MKRLFGADVCALCGSLLAALAICQPAAAQIIYATSITTGSIYSVDAASHAVTPVFNTGAALDSLFFDDQGRIIYDQLYSGRVLAYNPHNHLNVVLATGLSSPIDMALEPSLASFLVSDSTSNSLSRVSLSGGVLGGPLPLSGRPDGIIYDANHHLFVNVSSGFQNNNSRVEEIDPTNGHVIASSANTRVFLDGLTYDSFTDMLFASDYNNGRIVEMNPNTLTFTVLTPQGASLSDPDGITSDGQGHLYIASRANSHVIQYNIASNTSSVIGTINGLDDLAPVSGLGAPVPEPDTFTLLTCASLSSALLLRRRWKRFTL